MKNISAKDAHQWLLDKKAVLIDVREPAEVEATRIESAIVVPLSGSLTISETIAKDLAIIVVCRSGNRSSKACPLISKQFPNHQIYNLDGGVMAWEKGGYPLIRSSRKVLPLDQQVQLTVGCLVLLASLLGFFSSPWFLLISAFVGSGLIFAGLSGTCGLAMLLARMPWNKASTNSNTSCKL